MLCRYSILAWMRTAALIALAVGPASAARATIFKPIHPVAAGSLHPAARLLGPVRCPSKFHGLFTLCAPVTPVIEHIPGH
jgi:hypothetical protein